MVTGYQSGQIIATSHDLTPNGGFVMEIPLFQGNLFLRDTPVARESWRRGRISGKVGEIL